MRPPPAVIETYRWHEGKTPQARSERARLADAQNEDPDQCPDERTPSIAPALLGRAVSGLAGNAGNAGVHTGKGEQGGLKKADKAGGMERAPCLVVNPGKIKQVVCVHASPCVRAYGCKCVNTHTHVQLHGLRTPNHARAHTQTQTYHSGQARHSKRSEGNKRANVKTKSPVFNK